MIDENEIKPSGAKKLGAGLIYTIVILSLLCGSAAGFLGGIFAARSSHLADFNAPSHSSPVSEESATIDVVKKASPAVVSILISKDLSSQQQQSDIFSNPFFFSPFFQMPSNPAPAAPKSSTPNFQQVGAGSGFFISADGMIVTNKHVVQDSQAKYAVLTSDGKKYDAKVLSTDPVNDLAILKIDISNAPTLNLADSSKIEIGQRVIAIGNSLGQYSNTVTEGIVSGIGRNITAGSEGVSEQLEGVIQTDAAINPGNSGGPLLNIFGDVIDINTAMDQQGQLVGFAIAANDIKKAVQSYQRYGKIVRPFLGIRYVLITDDIKSKNNLPVAQGAWVISGQDDSGNLSSGVVAGSAADKAGIKNNDIIVSVNGSKIDQQHSLASIVRTFNPGDTISLDVIRDKKHITIKVTLEESK